MTTPCSTANTWVRGKFDFLYLRIDFANMCNVGYAFVNFDMPMTIVEVKQKLEAHEWPWTVEKFRNSSVKLELPNCRPRLFRTFQDFPDPLLLPLVGSEKEFPKSNNEAKLARSRQNAETTPDILLSSATRLVKAQSAIAPFSKSLLEYNDSDAGPDHLTCALCCLTGNRVRSASDSSHDAVLAVHKSFLQREKDRQRRREPQSCRRQRHLSDMDHAFSNPVLQATRPSCRQQDVPQEQSGQPQQWHRSGPPKQLSYDRTTPTTASDALSLDQDNRAKSSNNPRIPLPALIPQQPHLPPFEVGSLKMSDLRLAILSRGDRWYIVRRLGLRDTFSLSSNRNSTASTSDNELPFFFAFQSSNPLFDPYSAAQLSILKWWSYWKQQQLLMNSRLSHAAYLKPRGPISFAEGQLPAIDPEPPLSPQRRDLHLPHCVRPGHDWRYGLQPNLPLKGNALLAAHLDSIAEFAKSKFPGNKVYYTVKRAHIKEEPLYLGFDQRWALSKWKASVWRYDKQRHYSAPNSAARPNAPSSVKKRNLRKAAFAADNYIHDIRVAARPDSSVESYMDCFHKDDTELIFPGNYEAFQTPYSLPQPPTTPCGPLQDPRLAEPGEAPDQDVRDGGFIHTVEMMEQHDVSWT
ncbi:Meiosis protein Mei2 [Lasiodiplodia theobromae]|uniref:Meiosis protein Mei2 n=1 Tax=Lasiodiplodia theobromae TaxID=45133 RepID=UPI0015C30C46|nr:Meiosis protein Mei2 [Lasiodiplodia theobromae]KAF4544315.1 Meiosis protein Mei2 [Lasiodiplodia theobromae]